MAESDFFSHLPSPQHSSRSILLCPELQVEQRSWSRWKDSLRSSLYKYAKEAEKEDTLKSKQKIVKKKTPALGSADCQVISIDNHGFFSAILGAYNNHYALRTCPEDWWFTIIRKIAVDIDKNAKSETVRKFFVSHEGKKTLQVEVGPDIYGVDYSWFLDQMTQQISESINVPNYVDVLKSDFSTTTPTHCIVSEITVMASMQEFFDYRMMTCCGIPSVEMEGEEKDWARLKEKFLQLKAVLEPIHNDIGLNITWWEGVEKICDKLLETYKGLPDTDWWSRILSVKYAHMSGHGDTYDGWFIFQLLGLGAIEGLAKLNCGVVTAPLTIVDEETERSEEAAFVGGIAGFQMFKEGPWNEGPWSWPSVKAIHGWVLMLEPNSAFRKEMMRWESKLVLGA